MNTKKILGVVAVLALVAVAMVGAGAATTQVGTLSELQTAIATDDFDIALTADITLEANTRLDITHNGAIEGNNHYIKGTYANASSTELNGVICVDTGKTVSFKNLTIIGPNTDGSSAPTAWAEGCDALKVFGNVTIENVTIKGSCIPIVVGLSGSNLSAPDSNASLTVNGSNHFVNNLYDGINVDKYGALTVTAGATASGNIGGSGIAAAWIDEGVVLAEGCGILTTTDGFGKSYVKAPSTGTAKQYYTFAPAGAKVGTTYYTSLGDAFQLNQSSTVSPAQITIDVLCDHDTIGFGNDNFYVDAVINMHNHVVTFSVPAAGSTGTETQGMRVTEGSKISVNDGTLAVSNAELTSYQKAILAGKNVYKNDNGTFSCHTITGSDDTYTVKNSDMFFALINSYGNLDLTNVVLDGTNLDRTVDQKYYKDGTNPQDVFAKANAYQNIDTTLVVNDGTVTFKGVTITSPVSTKNSAVRAVAIENQGGESGHSNGSVVVDDTSKTNVINGYVYLNGSHGLKDNATKSTLLIKSNNNLTINGLLETTAVRTLVDIQGHLTLNGTGTSTIAGELDVAANTFTVQTGNVVINYINTVSVNPASIELGAGSTLTVTDATAVSLAEIEAKLKTAEKNAVIVNKSGSGDTKKDEAVIVTDNYSASSGIAIQTTSLKSATGGDTVVKMTAQVKYEVTIPASMDISDGAVVSDKYKIKMTTPAISGNDTINMKVLSSAFMKGDNFAVQLIGGEDKLAFAAGKTYSGSTIGSPLAVDTEVVSVYTTSTTEAEQTVYYGLVSGESAPKAGSYQGTLTFVVGKNI